MVSEQEPKIIKLKSNKLIFVCDSLFDFGNMEFYYNFVKTSNF